MPKVSVVIPTLDRDKLLKEALISVKNQTFSDYEVIVVDDGSKDNTEKVVEEFRTFFGDSLKYIKKEHGGVSSARNRGILESSSPYIAFLDSDDLWMKDKLRLQVEYLERNRDAKVVHTDEIWIKDGKVVNQRKKHKKSGGSLFFRSLLLCLISPSSVMLKKEVLSDIGFFDEKMPACEDYDLWLRLTSKYEVHFIPKPLVIKRAGQWPQLSKEIEVLDIYRIYSLQRLFMSPLDEIKRVEVFKELKRRCKIVAGGARKRKKFIRWAKYSLKPVFLKALWPLLT